MTQQRSTPPEALISAFERAVLDHDYGSTSLDEVTKLRDELLAALSEQQERHWVYAAAEAHRHRLGYLEMGDRATESKHIAWMLDQIRDAGFSPTKACRWLGWVQAALYQAGIPLEELKAINRVTSESSSNER